jgi:uncharacterized protein HemX
MSKFSTTRRREINRSMEDEPQEVNDVTEPPPDIPETELKPDMPVEAEDEDEQETSGSGRSWLVIALVAVAALAVGLLLGYVGRGQFGPEAQAAKATQTVVAGQSATQAAGNKQLMDYLIGQARHSKGPEDAKVTIIEFSDYQ